MDKEIAAMESTYTWELTSLPKGKKAIGSKWVLKTKIKLDGSVECCKARIVARGDKQIEEKDSKHTFSPVPKFSTVHTLIALVAAHGWIFNKFM